MGIARPGIGTGVMAGCGLAIAIIGYMYLHSREAAPLQDPSPDATSALYLHDVAGPA